MNGMLDVHITNCTYCLLKVNLVFNFMAIKLSCSEYAFFGLGSGHNKRITSVKVLDQTFVSDNKPDRDFTVGLVKLVSEVQLNGRSNIII